MSDTSSVPILPVTVISAGAGSGKTYSLTERMLEMIQGGVRPSAIMATTFTKKAAAELQERVRARLLETGRREEANELGNALIGTVHSIGVKLLQRFAFDAGVSPLVEVIADGDEQRLFNESLAQILTNDRTTRMNELADRLGLTKSSYGKPFDWRSEIRNLTDVARANNFSNELLEKSRQLSWASFAELLPPPSDASAIQWNNQIVSAMEQCIAALEDQTADTTLDTKNAIVTLNQTINELKWRGALYWHEWVKLSKLKTGAKSRDIAAPLKELAAQHEKNSEFQADIKAWIDLVFEISMDALREYEQYKKKRGLIDYTDMETSISALLRRPSVRKTLSTELDLLLVDEFQDTSPIQLDIFLQLSQMAKHSVWVGDPKQSIYGFRGAEPALMEAIIDATGGIRPENILKKSWRSRPDLVEAVNAIFSRAFDQTPDEQVKLIPAFSKDQENDFWKKQGIEPHPALLHWHFINTENNNKAPGAPWADECIAQQIRVLLERKIPVFDKKRSQVRPIQPGDIAVLCRKNTQCAVMAEALHKAGLQAAISRAGLLQTPEIRLTLAWLKRLINPNDRLSAAEIKLISGATNLEALLREIELAPQGQKWAALEIAVPGGDLLTQSAAEVLDLLIAEKDLRRVVARLGNAVQRLDNLEVLRKYAEDYESACNRLHTASTISGFLLWLDRLGDMEMDFQGSGESPDTIHVLTYHRSKGLEYPVCICHNLDDRLKENIWGLDLVAASAPDLNDILGGRWLRYWVNPYADLYKNTALEERIRQTDMFALANRRALEEEARLLYVGLTRARDYMIFPTTANAPKWLNRVFNKGNGDIPVFDPHSDETPFYTPSGEVLYCRTELIYQPKSIGAIPPEWKTIAFPPPAPGRKEHLPFRVHTSDEMCPTAPAWQLGAVHSAPALPVPEDIELSHWHTAAQSLLLASVVTADSVQDQLLCRQIAGDDLARIMLQWITAWNHQAVASGQLVKVKKRTVLQFFYEERRVEIQADILIEGTHQQLTALLLLPFSADSHGIKRLAPEQITRLGWLREGLLRFYPDHKITYRIADLLGGEIAEVWF